MSEQTIQDPSLVVASEPELKPEPPPPILTDHQLTVLDDDYRNSPYPSLAEMHERDPVHRDRKLKRFFIVRQADVAEVLADTGLRNDPSASKRRSFMRNKLAFDPERDPIMQFMDGPEHARLRRIVGGALSDAAVDAFRPRIQAIVKDLLDWVENARFDIELVSQYARPITNRVIAEFLGIDAAELPRFTRCLDIRYAVIGRQKPSKQQLAANAGAREDLRELLREQVAARRAAPGSDMISTMLRGDGVTAPPDDAEMVRLCEMTLIASVFTTRDLIANGIRAMLQNTLQMTRVRTKPALIRQAIEETLRFDSPVISTHRIADRNIVVGGRSIPRGEVIMVSLAGANHDPSVYEDADDFDVLRPDTHHYAFGGGTHACPGASLARAVAAEAILGLIVQFEEMELGRKGYEFAVLHGYHSMQKLWVRT